MNTGHTQALARDAILLALVAMLVFLGLRRFVGDRYLVPSGSMEPVLHGDPVRGDVVFVAAAARAAGFARGDLVVAEHPQEPGQRIVKRIAACGDDPAACWIDLRDGDVWLGASAQRLQRVAKDPLDARAQRVPWAAWPGSADAAKGLDLRPAAEVGTGRELPPLPLEPAAARELFRPDVQRARRRASDPPAFVPAGCLGTSRSVDASYLDRDGRRGREGEDVGVLDAGMVVALAAWPEALLASVERRGDAFSCLWRPASGDAELWHNGAVVARRTLPPPAAAAGQVEFGWLDEQWFLCVDGRREALWCEPRQPAWARAALGDEFVRPQTFVHVAALGTAPLRLTALRVFRDVHVWRERIAGLPGQPGDWPRYVPPGHWFVLGDNPFDSRDSRHFGPVATAACRGRPLAVLGPWPHCRWLVP